MSSKLRGNLPGQNGWCSARGLMRINATVRRIHYAGAVLSTLHPPRARPDRRGCFRSCRSRLSRGAARPGTIFGLRPGSGKAFDLPFCVHRRSI